MSDVTAAKKPRGTDDVPVPPTLRKSLKNRHVQVYGTTRQMKMKLE